MLVRNGREKRNNVQIGSWIFRGMSIRSMTNTRAFREKNIAAHHNNIIDRVGKLRVPLEDLVRQLVKLRVASDKFGLKDDASGPNKWLRLAGNGTRPSEAYHDMMETWYLAVDEVKKLEK